MNAKDAVAIARNYFSDIFGEPGTIEEVWFDAVEDVWCVTLGRRRTIREAAPSLLNPIGSQPLREVIDYKVVRINKKDEAPISEMNREMAA